MRKTALYICAALVSILWLASVSMAAEVVVIVNPANSNTINKSVVSKIYTGAMATWPGGGAITAVDLSETSETRAAFTSGMLGKSVASLKALWAQIMFTGRALPPKVVESDDDVIALVAKNRNAIGYVKASSVNGSVKIAFK